MTEESLPGMNCPACDQTLFPLRESPDFPDATYTETCPYCFEEYSYIVRDGKVSLWEPPVINGQNWKGAGKPGGSE